MIALDVVPSALLDDVLGATAMKSNSGSSVRRRLRGPSLPGPPAPGPGQPHRELEPLRLELADELFERYSRGPRRGTARSRVERVPHHVRSPRVNAPISTKRVHHAVDFSVAGPT
ncbi:hypothetical protein C9J85_02605 [Haloferax sp. wsp5]|nr:hypothetical protein C9J85_02605 [Haloferax sp. wsp5]